MTEMALRWARILGDPAAVPDIGGLRPPVEMGLVLPSEAGLDVPDEVRSVVPDALGLFLPDEGRSKLESSEEEEDLVRPVGLDAVGLSPPDEGLSKLESVEEEEDLDELELEGELGGEGLGAGVQEEEELLDSGLDDCMGKNE